MAGAPEADAGASWVGRLDVVCGAPVREEDNPAPIRSATTTATSRAMTPGAEDFFGGGISKGAWAGMFGWEAGMFGWEDAEGTV